tara:strand:+ start:1962 stop:2129 length:168 start_codon:yes stop_codon:yes gene_type:complete
MKNIISDFDFFHTDISMLSDEEDIFEMSFENNKIPVDVLIDIFSNRAGIFCFNES